MPAYQPTADRFRAFRDDPYDGPIAQVNLLEHVELHGLSQFVATDPSPAPSTYGPCQTGSATPMLPVVPIAAG